MPDARGLRARRFCFTLFTYDTASLSRIVSLKDTVFSKIVYQEEKAPDTGRLHIQGFIVFKKQVRISQAKEVLGPTAHLEVAKGNDRQNYVYCTKGDCRTGAFSYSYGDFESGGPGKRSDLAPVVEAIKSGASLEEINSNYSEAVIRFGRGIQLSRSLWKSKNAKASFECVVICVWGPAGCGKSMYVRDYCNRWGLSYYSKPPGQASAPAQWFDGYDGERALILDDFCDSQVPYRELLIWLDVYKHRVQVKGGFVVREWTHVLFTSNSNPIDWYSPALKYSERQPLRRRLDHIFESKDGPPFCSEQFSITLQVQLTGRIPPDTSVGVVANDASVSVDVGDSVGVGREVIPVYQDEVKGEEKSCGDLPLFESDFYFEEEASRLGWFGDRDL